MNTEPIPYFSILFPLPTLLKIMIRHNSNLSESSARAFYNTHISLITLVDGIDIFNVKPTAIQCHLQSCILIKVRVCVCVCVWGGVGGGGRGGGGGGEGVALNNS